MFVRISIAEQLLTLFDERGHALCCHPVSTASKGAGEAFGSYCTPRGKHIIRAKIGAGVPENTVFIARRPNGEIYSPELAAAFPGRDWILTRILWLSGCEPQRNRFGGIDTMRRYIYIHGTPEEGLIGRPASHGCVRMLNADVVDLFSRLPEGTLVYITP